jgi:predicted dehydrogenase
MKLGLLGIDDQIAPIVAAARRRGDDVALVCDVAADSPHAAFIEGLPRADSWEALVDPRATDAVLVGADGWNELRAEGVRKLVQAGRTLVLSQPLELSMLWAYEIDMIRRDSGARLIPVLPDRLQPFIERLKQAIEAGLAGAGSLGPLETIECQRRLRDRSRERVLGQLARDADLLRVLVGDPRRLSTLGGGETDAAWGTLAVGLTGAANLPVRWRVARGESPGLSLTLVGSAGSLAVDIPADDAAEWTLTVEPGGRVERAAFDRAATILGLLEGSSPAGTQVAPAMWDDAARAIELAETVPRSLAKGRAIDLHQEEFSELGTFKGTMASLGCAIVLGGLFVLLLATLVGGIAKEAGWEFGERIAGVWPVAVLVVLGTFLVLQLLPLLIGSSPPDRGGAAGSDPTGRQHE